MTSPLHAPSPHAGGTPPVFDVVAFARTVTFTSMTDLAGQLRQSFSQLPPLSEIDDLMPGHQRSNAWVTLTRRVLDFLLNAVKEAPDTVQRSGTNDFMASGIHGVLMGWGGRLKIGSCMEDISLICSDVRKALRAAAPVPPEQPAGEVSADPTPTT